jgi:hypothetical protein
MSAMLPTWMASKTVARGRLPFLNAIYDNLVCPADIGELIADIFESVYDVDTCDSDTEDMSGPSDGCGFSGIQLSMSDLEAAISGLDANKGQGNIQMEGFLPHTYFQDW